MLLLLPSSFRGMGGSQAAQFEFAGDACINTRYTSSERRTARYLGPWNAAWRNPELSSMAK